MRSAQILRLLIGALVSANVFAANFVMVAIGAFGEPFTECRVESFRSTKTKAKRANDYKERFRGLAANALPNGEYTADISCREARIGTYVTVSDSHRFEVVSENRRIIRSHPIAHLVIRMNSPLPTGETWWLALRALYGRRSDTVQFQSDTAETNIADPDPGSYVVSVLSSTGYNCLREIDLVERTSLWTFDPAACTFHVDEFAHVVTEEDKRNLKKTDWYQRLRKSEEELFRALERAAKDTADPDSKK